MYTTEYDNFLAVLTPYISEKKIENLLHHISIARCLLVVLAALGRLRDQSSVEVMLATID